ncbi:MAG: hypothetical protein PHC66_04565 [Candidatus Nanoarchaeia archaeon]|nr:hypothetical protein [Candidatus Nanoarchaeia archaeon]MDD5239768.1 hypothetical protein [Candidatus Nanoarchaeia archaeon]
MEYKLKDLAYKTLDVALDLVPMLGLMRASDRMDKNHNATARDVLVYAYQGIYTAQLFGMVAIAAHNELSALL